MSDLSEVQLRLGRFRERLQSGQEFYAYILQEYSDLLTMVSSATDLETLKSLVWERALLVHDKCSEYRQKL